MDVLLMTDDFLLPDFEKMLKDDKKFFEEVTNEKPVVRKLPFGFITVSDMTDEEFMEWVEKECPF